VEIHRHPLPLEASGALGFLLEYGAALFWETVLAWKIYFKQGIDVIQGCNPPDLIFLVALPFKLLGVKYIFDHHDINPELYEAKFNKRGFFWKLMVLFEKLTFKAADVSMATNNSYRQIAIERGGMRPDKVYVVRSGPDLSRLKRVAPVDSWKNGRRFLVGYVGVMGDQEGIDLLIESVQGRHDHEAGWRASAGRPRFAQSGQEHDGVAHPRHRHCHCGRSPARSFRRPAPFDRRCGAQAGLPAAGPDAVCCRRRCGGRPSLRACAATLRRFSNSAEKALPGPPTRLPLTLLSPRQIRALPGQNGMGNSPDLAIGVLTTMRAPPRTQRGISPAAAAPIKAISARPGSQSSKAFTGRFANSLSRLCNI